MKEIKNPQSCNPRRKQGYKRFESKSIEKHISYQHIPISIPGNTDLEDMKDY